MLYYSCGGMEIWHIYRSLKLQEDGAYRSTAKRYEPNTLGERIKKLRCSENIGEQLLCDALGMQLRTLRMIENGEKEPTLHQLAQLAGFFDTTVDYLLKGEDK